MSSLTLGTLFAGAAAWAQQPASSEAGRAQPSLAVGQTVHQAGTVQRGETIVHAFPVRNAGTAPLLIVRVTPGCGCTVPTWDHAIAPGESGRIELRVDTSAFRGAISKFATVTTNDPARTTFRLIVNALVHTAVEVLPRSEVFFRQHRGEQERRELRIVPHDDPSFAITDVSVKGDSVRHELTAPAAPGGEWGLAVWIDPAAPPGKVHGSVELSTTSSREPRLKVKVEGTILGDLTVSPSSLFFHLQPGGPALATHLLEPAPADAERQSKVLTVSHRTPGRLRVVGSDVEGATIGRERLIVRIEPLTEGQSYRVTITLSGTPPPGNHSGTLVLYTSDPAEPEIRVPIYLRVAP